jgi:hypothetical protein
MDKKGIIDSILNEWAAECDDGMAGGHLTNNNISTLASVLEKRGLSKDEVLEIITPMMDEAARGYGDDIDKEWDELEKKRELRLQKEKEKQNEPTSSIKSGEEDPEDPNKPKKKDRLADLESMVKEKRYKPKTLSSSIFDYLKKNVENQDIIKFLDVFNSVSGTGDSAIRAASNIYDSLPDTIKTTLNNLHTGQKRSALGKGEIVFVWIIQGATHGGIETGDIILGDFKVDIKDYESGGISIERTSFEGFDLMAYVDELQQTLNIMSNQEIKEYCLSLMEKHKEELEDFAKKCDTKGASAANVIKYTANLLNNKSISKLNKNAKCGLDFISKKIDDIVEKEKDNIPTTMSVYQKGERSQAVIDAKDLFTNEPIQQALNNISPAGKEIAINVKPLDAETRKREGTILSTLLKANYLRRKDKWTGQSIWAEMASKLHYNGIVLLTNNANKVLEYVPRDQFATRLKFDSLGKSVTVKRVSAEDKMEE